MIIARIRGGLGNQLFQYAAGRAVAHRRRTPLLLDLDWFRAPAGNETPRSCMLQRFPVDIRVAAASDIDRLSGLAPRGWLRRALGRGARPKATHVNEETLARASAGDLYLDGYWQHESWFRDAAELIRTECTPRHPIAGLGALSSTAAHDDSLAVHIRRGDYLLPVNRDFHGLLEAAYFDHAVQAMATSGPILVFSDDPAHAAAMASRWPGASPVSTLGLDPADELLVMSLCRHHVISNSSFGWWGAWLSRRNGKTIAPRRWFTSATSIPDPCPATWIRA